MATSYPRGTILRHPDYLDLAHTQDWIVCPDGRYRRWKGGVVDAGKQEYIVLGRLPPHLVETAREWRDAYKLPADYNPITQELWWVEKAHASKGWYARRPGFWVETAGYTLVEPVRAAVCTPKSQLRPGTVFRLKAPHKSFAPEWVGNAGKWDQPLVVIGNDRFHGAQKGTCFRRLSMAEAYWGSVSKLPDDFEIIGQLPEDDMDATEFPVSKKDHTEPTVEVRDMNVDRVKELKKEVEKENIDRARASMEASNTNRPEGRKMSFMKKLLIVFTVGTLAGGNIGNLKDAGVAVADYFRGPNEIIAGEFVAAPTCKDCSEIFTSGSQVVICGKCGSEKIGKVVYAPLYRDRGFPLTDQQVGIQIRNDDGSKSVVLETGEKIEVEK